METAIGGYFGLELNNSKKHFHENALRLNTARCCLEYILRVRKYRKIYIPFYTCEVIIEPIKRLGLEYEFYAIDEQLEPLFNKIIGPNECFLYTNYFGIKQSTVENVSNNYKNIIIDNSQAFYAPATLNVDTFYSARKFFGVADGAYLYTDKLLDMEFPKDISFERMSHLLKRLDIGAEAGYADFSANDHVLTGEPIKEMSNLTSAILKSIDYETAKEQRIKNFNYLHGILGKDNLLTIDIADDIVPMVYPFRIKDLQLRERLISHKVFVAKYWPNVLEWCNADQLEYSLAQEIIPLPVDQRYSKKEMMKIIEIITR